MTNNKIYKNLEFQFKKVFTHLKVGSFKTRERYAKAFKRFMVFLAEEFRLQKLSNILGKHIIAYVNYLQKKDNAVSTIKTELSAIRFFHDNLPYAKYTLPSNEELGLEKRRFGGKDRTWDSKEYNLMIAKAMEMFSKAITHYSTTDDDQYGAFRIGPSYPFWVSKPDHVDGRKPSQRHAMFGNSIYFGVYSSDTTNGRSSLPGVRIFNELKEIKIMRDILLEGIRILEACENPNKNLLKLLNLSRFMHNTTVSGVHSKEFFMLKQRLILAQTPENAEYLIDEIEKILIAERKNAEDTIPLVKIDSRLGWEPSMEYTTNEECLRWKIRQVDHKLNYTLPMYRSSNRLTEIYK